MCAQITEPRSNDYYVESLYLLVEDVIFDAPRYYFEQSCDLITLISPRPREEHGAGWSKDRPIGLKGFTAVEFGKFLACCLDGFGMPRQIQRHGMTSDLYGCAGWGMVPQWPGEAVLKVSTLLGFQRARKEAITRLSPSSMRSIQRHRLLELICLARLYEVEQWLFDGYMELVNRESTLDDEEVKVLELKVVVMLFRMRDKTFKPTGSLGEMLKKEVEQEIVGNGNKNKNEILVPEEQEGSIRDPQRISKFAIYSPGYVILQVQGMHFRLPHKILTEGSMVLRDILGKVAEGATHQLSIDPHSISFGEFKAFLHAIWPQSAKVNHVEIVQDSSYWTSILKLSTHWKVGRLRQKAIQEISPDLEAITGGDCMKKLALARQYDVQQWMAEVYQRIANRKVGISKDEREILGMEVTLGLMELRDVNLRAEKKGEDSHQESCWKVSEIGLAEVKSKFWATSVDEPLSPACKKKKGRKL